MVDLDARLKESRQKYEKISSHVDQQQTRIGDLEKLVKDNQKVHNFTIF